MLLFVTFDVVEDGPLRNGPDGESDEPTHDQDAGCSKQDGRRAVTRIDADDNCGGETD